MPMMSSSVARSVSCLCFRTKSATVFIDWGGNPRNTQFGLFANSWKINAKLPCVLLFHAGIKLHVKGEWYVSTIDGDCGQLLARQLISKFAHARKRKRPKQPWIITSTIIAKHTKRVLFLDVKCFLKGFVDMKLYKTCSFSRWY